MTYGSPTDDVLIVEERVDGAPPSPARALVRSVGRIGGPALGVLALGAGTTALAIRLANRGRPGALRGGARRPLVNLQPRVAVFAPNLTVALPLGTIIGRMPGRVPAARVPARRPTARARRSMGRRPRPRGRLRLSAR